MPIYEYLCQKCRGHFEIMQKFSEAPKRKCPSCGGRLEKQISSSAFHLKGSGWYATGYTKKEEAKPKVEPKGEAPAASPSTSETPKTKPTKSAET